MSDDELDELDVGNEEDVEETLLEDDLADVSILSRAASNREPVVDLDLSSHWPSDLTSGVETHVSELLRPAQSGNQTQLHRGVPERAKYDNQYLIREKEFNKQYASIYFCRLLKLRPHVLRHAAAWMAESKGSSATEGVSAMDVDSSPATLGVCPKISSIETGHPVIVVGTVYKEMKLKPCILDEYTKQSGAGAGAGRPHYMADDDYLVLEDESGRATLAGNINVKSLVSGIVIAVKGKETSAGEFVVEDVCFPEMAPQPPLPTIAASDAQYVVLVSGLAFGHPKADPLPVQLLVDFLSGLLGNSTEQQFCSKINRVVIAGESLYEQPVEDEAVYKKKKQTRTRLTSPLKELDLFLAQLATSVQVDIMPGACDPSNFSLPQQPFHPCLFPMSSSYSTFTRVSNPASITAAGISFLGSSGQNLADIERFAAAEHPIQHMERMLRWRHLAPTAPDTLACYPFQTVDPFVIEQCPHVFFAGNQKQFATKLVTGPDAQRVRIVCVPSFVQTQTVVLVNLATLDCHAMKFAVPSSAIPEPAAST